LGIYTGFAGAGLYVKGFELVGYIPYVVAVGIALGKVAVYVVVEVAIHRAALSPLFIWLFVLVCHKFHISTNLIHKRETFKMIFKQKNV
jgi:hypothetical protein